MEDCTILIDVNKHEENVKKRIIEWLISYVLLAVYMLISAYSIISHPAINAHMHEYTWVVVLQIIFFIIISIVPWIVNSNLNSGNILTFTYLAAPIKVLLQFIISACIQIIFIVYWIEVVYLVDIISQFFDNAVSILITIGSILGIVSLGAVTVEKYVTSIRFGIPFKMSLVRAYDFADTIVSVFAAIVLAVVAPIFVVSFGAVWYSSFPPFILIPLIGIICWILIIGGLASSKFARGLFKYHRRFKFRDIFYWVYLVIVVITILSALSLSYLAYTLIHLPSAGELIGYGYSFEQTIASVAAASIAFQIAIVFALVVFDLVRNTAGITGESVIVTVDGIQYVIASRYSTDKWILVPCEITEEPRPTPDFLFGQRNCAIIKFTKGEFIIKPVDKMVLRRIVCSVVEKK